MIRACIAFAVCAVVLAGYLAFDRSITRHLDRAFAMPDRRYLR